MLSRGEPVSRGRTGEVFVGEAALAVRRVGERDAGVVDLDGGMMIGGLGLRRQPVHEGDRRGKVLEGVLLADLVTLQRPAVEALHPLLHFRRRQSHVTLLYGKRATVAGDDRGSRRAARARFRRRRATPSAPRS